MEPVDLGQTSIRDLNARLHQLSKDDGDAPIEILHPAGQHNIAVGLDAQVTVNIRGHAGYFAAGMNQQATVTIHGNAGSSVAENMMSGVVRVTGFASSCAGASGCGGLLVIEGDSGPRCGISLKGTDIVVGGSVGHMTAFMAQAGRLVVCGDAGSGLADSLYEAVIYVRGSIAGLGADAREEPMTDTDFEQVADLLNKAGFEHRPDQFKRVASAKKLYHWNPQKSSLVH